MTTIEQTPQEEQSRLSEAAMHHFAAVVSHEQPNKSVHETFVGIPVSLSRNEIEQMAHHAQEHNPTAQQFMYRQTVATVGKLSCSTERQDYETARNASDILRHQIGGVIAKAQAWKIDRMIQRGAKQ